MLPGGCNVLGWQKLTALLVLPANGFALKVNHGIFFVVLGKLDPECGDKNNLGFYAR